ncbi:nucleotidyltransferase domain-containing protein [Chlorobium sp. BLA1]|uniref:nucleotidyltransferase domain-containing protein n=1 Tax=Candidatus Chlorobium masyuteum TaxID=2716876 RepID=UPI0014246949|nr:nucleotidyltransferase domain-containing protein [Candidatus Chlorobium masyuteum]NHQ60997.1 nucleotidyltransferase domain-containing protein [Candidatus Chlorobium masyuteum]
MMYGLQDETIRKIHKVIALYPQVEQAILYGSRAKGTHKNGSDIDLTLCGTALTTKTLFEISEEIDNLHLPYTIDLSIFSDIDDPGIIEHIKRIGVIFYTRNHNISQLS